MSEAVSVCNDYSCSCTRYGNIGPRNVCQVFHVHSAGDSDASRIISSCDEIRQARSVSIDASCSEDRTMTFVITGELESVFRAKQDVLQLFRAQMVGHIWIPQEHYGLILRKDGLGIDYLQFQTRTSITFPPNDKSSDKITVCGPLKGVEEALKSMALTSQSNLVACERVEIPKIYHPFIKGAYLEKCKTLNCGHSVKISIPPFKFQSDQVILTGQRDSVVKIKEIILTICGELEKDLSTTSIQVRKWQHKSLIGPKGCGVSAIFNETGVSVLVPESESNDETVVLRGPLHKLDSAVVKIKEKLNAINLKQVTIPSSLHRHLIGVKGKDIQCLLYDHPSVHVEFNNKEEIVTIQGPSADVETVSNIVLNTAANMTSYEMNVDPKYYSYIIGQKCANIRQLVEEVGVTISIPDERTLAVCEKSKQTKCIIITGLSQAVEQARNQLRKIIESITERVISVEKNLHKHIIGKGGARIQRICEDFNVLIVFSADKSESDRVAIQGMNESVELAAKHIQNFAQELRGRLWNFANV